MRIYACEIVEIDCAEDTITIKIPQSLKLNGIGNVFVVDAQNALINRENEQL